MNMVMLMVSAVYLAAVFWFARKTYLLVVFGLNRDVLRAQKIHQELIEKKGNIFFERNQLEEETAEVFTLYDLTKEITKNFNEQDAFSKFQTKLKENVFCEECHLFDPDSQQLEEIKSRNDYFLFPLKGKRGILGYLAIRGASIEDKEKIMILSHQFALALQRIRLYQEIEKFSVTDSLTGIATRRVILEGLEEEIRRSKTRKKKMSFLMIDVDYFKRFNDRYGHLIGDQILCGVSDIIEESVREIDVIGRYGGEEFCVILPETDRDGAMYVAERVRAAVEKNSIITYDVSVHATISVGISTFPDDGDQISELIDKADWALYRAKKNGRNTVCSFGVYD